MLYIKYDYSGARHTGLAALPHRNIHMARSMVVCMILIMIGHYEADNYSRNHKDNENIVG